jgi:hypothetical protein
LRRAQQKTASRQQRQLNPASSLNGILLAFTHYLEKPYPNNISPRRRGIKTMKKATKAIIPGLTEEETKILHRVKQRAHRLDLCLFNCCGIRFGWGAAVGMIPVYVQSLMHSCPRIVNLPTVLEM